MFKNSIPVLPNHFKMDFQILDNGLTKVKWEVEYEMGEHGLGGEIPLNSDTMPIDIAMNGILYEFEKMKKVVAEYIGKKEGDKVNG